MRISASNFTASAAQMRFLVPPFILLFSVLHAWPAEAHHSRGHVSRLRHAERHHVFAERDHVFGGRLVRRRQAERHHVAYRRSTRHVSRVLRPGRHRVAACGFTDDPRYFCALPYMTRRASMVGVADLGLHRVADRGTIIGSRPAGCPHAYCGCGLRKYLGLNDVRLNLAANWARLFPHEPAPRPGLAAVRSHHVMYLEASLGDGLWAARDYNSGGGLSRIHTVNVRGYIFVDPHAGLNEHDDAATRRTRTAGMDSHAF